jgi:hypothetical protein
MEDIKKDIDLYNFCVVNYKKGLSSEVCPSLYQKIKKLKPDD